jgi:hypothetical protein
MTDLRSWLVPTLAGPFTTLWTLTILMLLLIGAGSMRIFGFDADTWAMALFLSGAFASGLFMFLAIADVVLLSRGLRKLPTGFRAFRSAALAPFGFYAVSLIPVPVTSLFVAVLWAAAAMALGAFSVRWLLGEPVA